MLDKEYAIKIINYIKKGIDVGQRRNVSFRLLDYYLSTQIDLDEFREFVNNNMNDKDKKAFGKFYTKNIKNIEQANIIESEETLLSCDYIVGNISLQLSEKKRIINFMKENDLPLSVYIFKEVAKKYIGGYINLKLDYHKLGYPNFNDLNYISNEIIAKVITGIKEGIIIDNKKYPFELLDYYMIVKLPLLEFKKYITKFSVDDKKRFAKFYRDNNSKDTSMYNDSIITLELVIKDYKIDEAEKYQILNYMIENNIPIFISLFMQVARRYVNGQIKLNNNCQIISKDSKQLQKIFTRYKEYDKIKDMNTRRY